MLGKSPAGTLSESSIMENSPRSKLQGAYKELAAGNLETEVPCWACETQLWQLPMQMMVGRPYMFVAWHTEVILNGKSVNEEN